MAAVFYLSIHVVLLVSACFASSRLPLSGKHPRLPRSSAGCKLTLYDGSIGSSPSLVWTTSYRSFCDGDWNDRASSAVVTGGCQWILYEHCNYNANNYDGNSTVISSGTYNFSSSPSSAFANNTLSAVYCLPSEGTPAIVLFEHDNYRGKNQVFKISNPDLGNFNDKASSFIITGGIWQLYTHGWYRGSNVTHGQGLYQTANSLTPVKNDSLSSVKLVGCSNLANPTNGQFSHTGGATFGQTATYSCNTGYNLVGDSTRTCQATGVWSGSAPICQSAGNVSFSLRNTPYQNNSLVILEDIGEGEHALVCTTKLTACCRPPYTGEIVAAMGNWYFPNGTSVPSEVVNSTSGLQWDFYHTRGLSTILMHRRRGGVNGTYRCEIPDALGVVQTIYIETTTGPTIHYHTTTTTASAVVEPSLDNRAQPVATEYAVPPISTHTVLVTGITGGLGMPIVIAAVLIVIGCVIMKRRHSPKRSGNDATPDVHKEKRTKEDVIYDVPASIVTKSIKMTECEAYGSLPNKH